jgi:hypothetical protein
VVRPNSTSFALDSDVWAGFRNGRSRPKKPTTAMYASFIKRVQLASGQLDQELSEPVAATQSDDGPEDINEVEDTYALDGGWGTNENADRPNGDHEGSYQPFHPELPTAAVTCGDTVHLWSPRWKPSLARSGHL